MYLGQIVEENSVEDLFEQTRHPYTKALLESVLILEPRLDVPDTQLGMAFPNPIDPPSGCHFHPRCASRTELCDRQAPRTQFTRYGRIKCHLYDAELQMPATEKRMMRRFTKDHQLSEIL